MDLQKTGQFISGLRKARGWTQRDLAERVGVTDKAGHPFPGHTESHPLNNKKPCIFFPVWYNRGRQTNFQYGSFIDEKSDYIRPIPGPGIFSRRLYAYPGGRARGHQHTGGHGAGRHQHTGADSPGGAGRSGAAGDSRTQRHHRGPRTGANRNTGPGDTTTRDTSPGACSATNPGDTCDT